MNLHEAKGNMLAAVLTGELYAAIGESGEPIFIPQQVVKWALDKGLPVNTELVQKFTEDGSLYAKYPEPCPLKLKEATREEIKYYMALSTITDIQAACILAGYVPPTTLECRDYRFVHWFEGILTSADHPVGLAHKAVLEGIQDGSLPTSELRIQ